MTKPLSLDLRRRIIRAVEEEGMTCRAAATRFSVAPSTVIELMRQWKETGSCEARPQGGDRRSGRVEAHAAQILALVEETPDISLVEIGEHLLAAHGERFVPSVLCRFFDRHDITLKKNRACQRANATGRGRGARRLAGPAA
jgi:transposase